MEHLTLAIDGMSCGHCVARVSKALSSMRGVRVGDVTVGSASLEYDPEATTPQQIRDAVEQAGYEARVA